MKKIILIFLLLVGVFGCGQQLRKELDTLPKNDVAVCITSEIENLWPLSIGTKQTNIWATDNRIYTVYDACFMKTGDTIKIVQYNENSIYIYNNQYFLIKEIKNNEVK